MPKLTVDPELLRDPGYRGALHILTSRTFRRNDPRLWPHVHVAPDDPPDVRHSIRFDRILDHHTWSSTEDLMLRAAWSLFNQDCVVNLWNLVNRLDDYQTATLVHAIAHSASGAHRSQFGLLHQGEEARS